jgi:hypothetical protein
MVLGRTWGRRGWRLGRSVGVLELMLSRLIGMHAVVKQGGHKGTRGGLRELEVDETTTSMDNASPRRPARRFEAGGSTSMY